MTPPRPAPSLTSRPLEPNSATPLHRQVYARLRWAILCGGLGPGSDLPSTRALAADLGVARNTVLAAYEQLLAEGYLSSRPGSGTVVNSTLPEELLHAAGPFTRPRIADGLGPPVSRRGAALVGIPSTLGRAQESVCAFRHGLPAVAEFPFETWSRLTARAWRSRPARLMSYGDPAGYQPLREAIAAYLGTARGVRCHPGQVVVVSGSQQALDVVGRVLLDPGDRVWIEDPGYLGARGAFLAAGARLVPAPVDSEGITLPRGAAKAGPIRLAYVTPAHQYPLGVTMSASRRLALLDWARRANAWVVEDDYDSEFRYAGRPLAALQGIDDQGLVIYVGTFSKVLFPALRLGYVVVPERLVDVFVRARTFADGHSPVVTQAVLAEFLTSGQFARHVRRMRRLYADRQAAFLRAARAEWGGLLDVEASDAGMHLIGWLAADADDREVAARLAARGIVATPLSTLALSPPRRGGLVFGYTALTPQAIRAGIRVVTSVLSEGKHGGPS